MKFHITLDRDEDGVWIAECLAIPGCVSQGKTKQEAIENIKEAIALCLEVRAEKGLPLTLETQQVRLGLDDFTSDLERKGSGYESFNLLDGVRRVRRVVISL